MHLLTSKILIMFSGTQNQESKSAGNQQIPLQLLGVVLAYTSLEIGWKNAINFILAKFKVLTFCDILLLSRNGWPETHSRNASSIKACASVHLQHP